MKKIVLAFIALNIFDVSGMRTPNNSWIHFGIRRPVFVPSCKMHKLDKLKLARPPIDFRQIKIKRAPNSLPVSRTSVNKELDIFSMMTAVKGVSYSNGIYKSVSLDNFLQALDSIEGSSDPEKLSSWEFSFKISSSDSKAELRCLSERNDIKDVYIVGIFPVDFSLNQLGLKNDVPYYYSGNGGQQNLFKGIFESLKAKSPNIECKIYVGDYDSGSDKLTYDTSLELSCNQ